MSEATPGFTVNGQCLTCKEFATWPYCHSCSDQWWVCDYDGINADCPAWEPDAVYAYSSEAAAEKYAEERHSDFDYADEVKLMVWSANRQCADAVEYFTVTAEPSVTFSATPTHHPPIEEK